MKAKRGDLAVIVSNRSYFSVADGVRECQTVEISEVTSITRDGVAKNVRTASGEVRAIPRWVGLRQVYIVPRAKVDIEAAMQSAAANPWPSGHPGMPYESLEQVRSMLREHKR